MPLLSGSQSGMLFPQREQRLYEREHVLLFRSATAGGEGILRVPRKASRKVAPVVGILAAGQRDFVSGIDLGDAAQRQQKRECSLELARIAAVFADKTAVVVIPDKGHQHFGVGIKLVMTENINDLLHRLGLAKFIPHTTSNRG